MKKSQFNEAKIVEILALPNQSKSVDEICRTHNISTATFYNWRNKYGGMDTEELRKLKALQAENARPKNCWPIRVWITTFLMMPMTC
jgi:putative transposase